jgi:hypothetical protein
MRKMEIVAFQIVASPDKSGYRIRQLHLLDIIHAIAHYTNGGYSSV